MKIFITGGMGYIGSELAKRAIKEGHEVMIYDNLMYEQDAERMMKEIGKAKLVIGDTRNLLLLRDELFKFKPDYVFHLAELSSVYACNHNPKFTEDNNFRASKAVLEMLSIMGLKTIYNSTSSVYGTQKEERLMNETDELPSPTDYYTRYKIRMEAETFYLKNLITFRPATIFGLSPRFRIELLPNHFTYLAVSRGLIKISDLDAYRAALDISELIDAYFKVMKRGFWNARVYNVGHHNMSKKQFAEGIQRVIPCEIGSAPDIGDLRNLQIDCTLFNTEFDFTPKKPYETSIREVSEWLKANRTRIENENFSELLNMPLNKWQAVCN